MRKQILMLIFASLIGQNIGKAEQKLSGTVIGTEYSVNYSNFTKSTTVNTKYDAFDGNLDTFFASWDRSSISETDIPRTWVGLDLGEKYVISKVGWAPRNAPGFGERRVQLGLFEGANLPDFTDAVPLYLIPDQGIIGTMSYADVNCSRGFRYVRYLGPDDARCNIAELEFYGEPGEGDDSHLYTVSNLPTVVIYTNGDFYGRDPVDKVNNYTSTISIISNKDDGTTTFFTAPGTTRLRGNASMGFDKKPYRIKFDKKQNILDSPAKAKKWTLINSWGDKTMLRNSVSFEIARRMGMDYVPYCRLVDVIYNGDYKGTYQLCDQVEINTNRVNVTKMEITDVDGDALTGGYLMEVDGYAESEGEGHYFWSNRGIPVTMKSPDESNDLPACLNYIYNYFNALESAVWSENRANICRYMDLDSFLKLFLVGEMTGNTDTFWSTYFSKERNDDIVRFGPIWDNDLALDNDYRTHNYFINQSKNSEWLFETSSGGGSSKAGSMGDFVRHILNSVVSDRIYNLWSNALYNGGLESRSLQEYVDDLAEEIDLSQQYNFKRWPILDSLEHLNFQALGSYDAEVRYLRNYIYNRCVWMNVKTGVVASGVTELPAQPDYVEIYNLQGVKVYSGNSMPSLDRGIYIINRGGTTRKVVITK